MAPRGERSGAPRTPGEKHGWLRFESYQEIHEGTLDRHPFVLEDRSVFTRTEEDGEVSYRLEGEIVCFAGIVIEVSKDYEVRHRRGADEIRGALYRYTARLPGYGNIVRYDNLHLDRPDEFHRHLFDLETWEEISLTLLSREAMPTFVEIIDEVQQIAADHGLLDSA